MSACTSFIGVPPSPIYNEELVRFIQQASPFNIEFLCTIDQSRTDTNYIAEQNYLPPSFSVTLSSPAASASLQPATHNYQEIITTPLFDQYPLATHPSQPLEFNQPYTPNRRSVAVQTMSSPPGTDHRGPELRLKKRKKPVVLVRRKQKTHASCLYFLDFLEDQLERPEHRLALELVLDRLSQSGRFSSASNGSTGLRESSASLTGPNCCSSGESMSTTTILSSNL